MDAADVSVWALMGICLFLTERLGHERRKRRRAERIADGAVELNKTLVACNDRLVARIYRRQAMEEPSRN